MTSAAFAAMLGAVAKAALGAVAVETAAGRRVGRMAVLWLVLALLFIVALGVLGVWHLMRRGRLIRASLAPPRSVGLVEFDSNAFSGANGSAETLGQISPKGAPGAEPGPGPASR